MKTLWQTSDREELVARLARLKADAQPQWGKMSCAQMLAHLTDGMRMTLGDLQCRPKVGPLRFGPLKHLIIYWLPFPKSAPTAPELIARTPASLDPEIAALKELFERFAASQTRQDWPEHPAFGPMSAKDWGALAYKHINHHLRQFGV